MEIERPRPSKKNRMWKAAFDEIAVTLQSHLGWKKGSGLRSVIIPTELSEVFLRVLTVLSTHVFLRLTNKHAVISHQPGDVWRDVILDARIGDLIVTELKKDVIQPSFGLTFLDGFG